jgi:hypothetical protein
MRARGRENNEWHGGALGRLIAQRWQKAKCEEFWAQDKASDSARAKTTRSNWRTSSKNVNPATEDGNESIENFGRTSDNRIDSMASPAVGSVKPVASSPSSGAVCSAAVCAEKKAAARTSQEATRRSPRSDPGLQTAGKTAQEVEIKT